MYTYWLVQRSPDVEATVSSKNRRFRVSIRPFHPTQSPFFEGTDRRIHKKKKNWEFWHYSYSKRTDLNIRGLELNERGVRREFTKGRHHERVITSRLQLVGARKEWKSKCYLSCLKKTTVNTEVLVLVRMYVNWDKMSTPLSLGLSDLLNWFQYVVETTLTHLTLGSIELRIWSRAGW